MLVHTVRGSVDSNLDSCNLLGSHRSSCVIVFFNTAYIYSISYQCIFKENVNVKKVSPFTALSWPDWFLIHDFLRFEVLAVFEFME